MKAHFLPFLLVAGMSTIAQAQDALPRLVDDAKDFCTKFPDGRFEPCAFAGFADTSATLFCFSSEQEKIQIVFADNGDGMLEMKEAVSFSAVLEPQNPDQIEYFQLFTLDRKTVTQRSRKASDAPHEFPPEQQNISPAEMLNFFNLLRTSARP
jgi:hypothetical protein